MENNRDRLKAKLQQGKTLVRILILHPMDTGQVKDEKGKLIPAHFIHEIKCWRNEKLVLTIESGTATAKNPYFSFFLTVGQEGDNIKVSWKDNWGEGRTVESSVV